jgi:hypothetical protein
MVHRCKIQYKILLDPRLLLVVNLLHQAQSRHRVVNHPLPVLRPHQVQHKLLLVILVIHLQINLLLKVAVVASPKQVKLKQPVIVTANRGLV